jgi:hypothetical protein
MSAPRKLPKISGFLHNCGVHLAIPEILEAIDHFAREEDGFEAKNNGPYIAHKNDYLLLKKIFEKYYAIPSLTWKQLFSILTAELKSNPLAQQIVLGPVLREFMSAKAGEAKEKKAESTIQELQMNGRYSLLDIPTISKYLFQPLGISAEAHELLPNLEGRVLGYSADTHAAKDPICLIEVYNAGKNHWERLPADEIKAAENGIEKLHSDTPLIEKVFTQITNGNSKENTLQSLQMLKSVVKQTAQSVIAASSAPPAPASTPASASSSHAEESSARSNPSSSVRSASPFDQYATKAENAYKHRIRKINGQEVEVKTRDDDAEKMGQEVKNEFERLLTGYQSGLFSAKPEDDESIKLAKKLQAEEFERAGFKKPR